MKKVIIIAITILCVSVLAFSLSLFITENHSDISKTKNMHDTVLLPAYTVKDNTQKWGYINLQGQFVIDPVFDKAGDFNERDRAIVSCSGKYGVINKNGDFVLKAKYPEVTDDSGAVFIVSDKSTWPTESKAVNDKGKVIFQTNGPVNNYVNGMARFSLINKEGTELYGFLDETGRVAIPAIYLDAENFDGSYAIVQTAKDKYRIIDKNGKLVKSLDKFFGAYGLSEGLFVFRSKDNRYGFADMNGNIIIKDIYEIPPMPFNTFHEGLAIIWPGGDYLNAKQGVINTKGEYVIKPIYRSIMYLGYGMFSVCKNDDILTDCALFDKTGKQLLDFKYGSFCDYKDGLTCVWKDNKTFFINQKGECMENMPILSGKGSLEVKGPVIEENVDDQLIYVDKKGKVIYRCPKFVIQNEKDNAADKQIEVTQKTNITTAPGIWVEDSSRGLVLNMINSIASGRYYFDYNGYLYLSDEKPSTTGSSIYSDVLNNLIYYNKCKVSISLSSSADEPGMVEGGNGHAQNITIKRQKDWETDEKGNPLYCLTLAHELIHAYRGEEGVRNLTGNEETDKSDEEANAIGIENEIRYQTGYALRTDGDPSDDANGDGLGDGDGSYGRYCEIVGKNAKEIVFKFNFLPDR